jgi:DNA-binding response OmpR family regulator
LGKTLIDSTLKNANILIVDDQQANIDVLTGLLDVKGFTNYITTKDSRQVLRLFEEFKPDLLLLDLNMPFLSGFSVMMQMKVLIPANSYFPILVLTADITHESKQTALSCGASDFLAKPFDLIEVDLRIKNLLKARYYYQQIENQNQILEEKVKERTKELEMRNIELIAAKEKA